MDSPHLTPYPIASSAQPSTSTTADKLSDGAQARNLVVVSGEEDPDGHPRREQPPVDDPPTP